MYWLEDQTLGREDYTSCSGRGDVLVRRSGSRSNANSLGAVSKLRHSFTPRCSSSLSCINEYLVIYSGGYVNE